MELKNIFLLSPNWELSKKVFPLGSVKILEQQQSCHLFLQACRTNQSVVSKLSLDEDQHILTDICEKFVSITQQLSSEINNTQKYDRHKVIPVVSKCIDIVLAILWQVS